MNVCAKVRRSSKSATVKCIGNSLRFGSSQRRKYQLFLLFLLPSPSSSSSSLLLGCLSTPPPSPPELPHHPMKGSEWKSPMSPVPLHQSDDPKSPAIRGRMVSVALAAELDITVIGLCPSVKPRGREPRMQKSRFPPLLRIQSLFLLFFSLVEGRVVSREVLASRFIQLHFPSPLLDKILHFTSCLAIF